MQIGFKVVLSVVAAVLLTVGSAQASNYTDVDILNFALNLECLEAEFYSWGAYGEGIYSVDSSLVGNNSALTASSSGGVATSGFSAEISSVITEIAENEIAHVRFLREALGSAAVPCPALSLSPATFTAAATAAVTAAGSSLNPTGQTFDPYTNADAFVLAAYIFEDVGVTAYKGAVQNLQNSTLAATAAGIMAIEAGHAAVIRDLLYGFQTASPAVTTGLTVDSGQTALDFGTAVIGINKLRDTLGGTTASSVESPLTRTTQAVGGVTATSGAPELFASDSNGVAFSRTPTQVLNIVYFSTNTTAGGFLPQGATGNSDVTQITSTSTKTCSSGALSMASFSAASVAAVAAAAALLL